MRLIGGLLLVGASAACGILLTGEAKSEIRALESLLELLRTLSRRLTWGRDPLRTLFAAYRDPYLERVGFLPALRNADGRAYPAVWVQALQTLPLPPDARKEAETLGPSLGRLPLDAQLDRLALCIDALSACRDAARQNAEKNRRSTVALWTLAGLLAALLLL